MNTNTTDTNANYMNDSVPPITSTEKMAILTDALARLNPVYVIILRLLVETDVPLSRLLAMKVSDLRGKSEITYQGRKHLEIIRVEPIPESLQVLINDYLQERAPDDYAFTNVKGNKVMHTEVFRLALKNTSAICGFKPPATVLMLHKTYLYNTYKVDQAKALSHASTISRRDFLRYIHLNEMADTDPSTTDVKEMFYSSNILEKVTRDFDTTIKTIADDTERPDHKPPGYFRDALRLLYDVDNAISRFNDSSTE